MLNFNDLSPLQYKVLMDYLNTGDSAKEIGDRMGISFRAVNTIFFRVRQKHDDCTKWQLLINYWRERVEPNKDLSWVPDHLFSTYWEIVETGECFKQLAKNALIPRGTMQIRAFTLRRLAGVKSTSHLILNHWKP